MHDSERSPTRLLTPSECWERLAHAPYGRIAAAAAGQVDIFPVNHKVDDGIIVFRTAAGTKLLELTIRNGIAFEVDGLDGDEAFSVVVKGTAEEFDRDADVREAEGLGVQPWAPEEKDRWVRIVPESIQGRSFTLASSTGTPDISA
ncbi:pyridoxamine 5'-phosphate oxidase family protein [Microbacterium sp. SSW1-49]|uniref:Pyridoxamine 5'-phosphate oxidase family protein n=1 Tax=Microbacterium croceum TaxID=2851645 RepID=A0ABT0FFE0_9MICO|nr:pyridoxamine 5'-phosphate oxidase family protein [Microbacterium croceum]MCK2036786.1 pyridoxamine 5'-phosphate oxidase family protein [Microbacterium croceum]